MGIDIDNGYRDLEPHVGHKIEVSRYGNSDNIAIECMTCGEVLLDFNKLDHEPLKKKYFRVEYDPEYTGGAYQKVGGEKTPASNPDSAT